MLHGTRKFAILPGTRKKFASAARGPELKRAKRDNRNRQTGYVLAIPFFI